MSVTIYTTPTCVYCKLAKEYLTEKGITFLEVDVSQDDAKAEEMVKKSGQMAVPVIIVVDESGAEELIMGFDKTRLATALGINE